MILGGSVPEISVGKITECAADIYGRKTICSNNAAISKMKMFLKTSGVKDDILNNLQKEKLVKLTKSILEVNNESEIYEHPDYKRYIGSHNAEIILQKDFKAKGPTDSTALLDNFNIDETLEKWSIHSVQEFKKKFYHMKFQMIDFDVNNTELQRLDIYNLIKDGYDCFGVVLNTDVSTGRGKHWFCLYMDLQHKGTKDDPFTLEYFNTSGYDPKPSVLKWLERTKYDLLKDHNLYVKIVYATEGRQIQYSKTECGVWCLVYILSRLLNKPYNWMISIKISDNDITEYRHRLFRKK